jgi:hypothetical protein
MINETAVKSYLLQKFPDVRKVNISRLGSGVQGTGFLVEMETPDGNRSYVVKTLLAEGLGHDYPSDRASVFLLDLDEYRHLPKHVEAVDVLAEMKDGTLKSIGGGKEYYLLMERAKGENYFRDLKGFAGKERLGDRDAAKIRKMIAYLADIHSVKKDSRVLYWRKLRDTVGHGECLMGVIDTYPEGFLGTGEAAAIVKKSIDRIYGLRGLHGRLSQIHGDFHPGNIWFLDEDDDPDFVLLDRSRGPWGEPADDLTALAVNYIFFSVIHHGDVRGPYREALKLFFREYIRITADSKILDVVAPFFAFRGVVVANPVFYPEVTPLQRTKLVRFVHNVLDESTFLVQKVNEYLR